ncbi:RidA family protein [Alkalicaulis satelles]|uniref:RidA family protein n=1 Tax=Alkalicaulis satelles TaxID=2609175 RepID=A0A5M6ZI26_9PROT|nr:RidA family protein [Alkalicaulis satelles]KAA5804486.1 RidA family protein [Alkalicaulis satelles]
MTKSRVRITSGAPWEDRVGYRRAVRCGDQVFVSGTVSVDADGRPHAPGDAGAQAERCLEIILAALAQFEAGPEHVVRTRIYVTDMAPESQAAVGAAHRAVFAAHPPASTMVGVSALAAPDFIVEIEADAILDQAGA